jgi:molybdopterin-containing oxidoreductase family iron-sulfur binding subunit
MLPSRRDFVRTLSAAMAAWGLDGCVRPGRERIEPYVKRPPESVPGVPEYYATSLERDGYGIGVLGECHTGHPTKVEGNLLHPASLGALGAPEQAAILDLYDQDRVKIPRQGEMDRSWDEVRALLAQAPWARRQGEGLHVLLRRTASPLRAALLQELALRYPRAAVWFTGDEARWAASRALAGEALDPQYDLTRATRIVALDADFLADGPFAIRLAHDWAERRRIRHPDGEMNRTYAVESFVTPTGVSADHRLPVTGAEVPSVAAALLGAVGHAPARAHLERSPHRAWIEAVGRDLVSQRGRVAVFVGARHGPDVHALGMALNALLGADVVRYGRTPIVGAGGDAFDLRHLTAALEAGAVDTLLTLETNPAYELLPDLRWKELALRARERIHLAYLPDETAEQATWTLPALHDFERWGDTRAWDGTAAPVQPLIRPLVDGQSVDGVLAMLLGDAAPDLRARLVKLWGDRFDGALPRGVLEPGQPPATANLDANAVRLPEEPPAGFVLDVVEDPRAGRRANNIWLRELPEPTTKLTWDNAAILGPETAKRLDVEDEDVVEIRRGDQSIRLPVFVLHQQAENAVTVWSGYGRYAGGQFATMDAGVDVNVLRTSDAPWIVPGVDIVRTDETFPIANTQKARDQHRRPILLRASLDEWRKRPDFTELYDERPHTILPDRVDKSVQQWGMVIDQTVCTGCSACVVACVSENNIPMVGKDEVALGREMHWLRIDIYHGEWDENAPEGRPFHWAFQPMMCVHCEKAPCEYVCPVAATAHSYDGINEMTYNRCIGTRFCSNNCPYKVRRFNFHDWNRGREDVVKMHANPDVTVRGRGVMEKCNYCVQRLRGAEIEARTTGRPIQTIEVKTACAQSCPTGALVFGQISDPESEVSKRREEPQAYGVLNEQGTFPRTRHLARIENRNPEMEA